MAKISLIKRIQSFKDIKLQRDIFEYAAAGFMMEDSKKGILTCTFCDKSLAGWENEEPFQEHLDHPNNCPILNLFKLENRKKTFSNPKLEFLSKKFFCYKFFEFETIFCYRCGFCEHFINDKFLSERLAKLDLLDHKCPKRSKRIFVNGFFQNFTFLKNILLKKPTPIENFDFLKYENISYLISYIPMDKISYDMPFKDVLKLAATECEKKIKEKMLKDSKKYLIK